MDNSLPDEISIYNFIKSHIAEINSLKKQCRTKQCKNLLQRVPRHIRRRAASNNPKRLPKNLQKLLLQSQTSNNQTSSKKRRKIRKRKISKRNQDPSRSLLHMWFTKRFKMEFMWNMRIPWKNNMKNQRILYRGTKNGCICYYLPFLVIFRLELFDEKSYQELSDFIPSIYLEQMKNAPLNHSFSINVYENHKYPYNLIGPCDLIKIKNNDHGVSFIFIAHRLVFDALKESLNNFKFEAIDCSYIRLHGPHSLSRLNRKFNQKLPVNQIEKDRWYYLKINDTFELSDFSEFFTPGDNIGIRRYDYANDIDTIDVLIPNLNLRKIWNLINVNMSHLVGGLRDLEVMSIDTATLLYPRIGYIDCIWNRNENLDRFTDYKDKYIIRNPEILNAMNQNRSIDKVLNMIIDPENAMIQVMVDYCKGASDISDIILLPKSLYFLPADNDENIIDNRGDNEKIGMIEYGCFSMRMAHSRAIGIITLQGLQELYKINKTHNDSDIFSLVQTKFNHLRIVKISLIINSM